MKRQIQISVLGIQNAGSEPETISTKVSGTYSFEHGLHKINYCELDENGAATDNLIFLSEKEMKINKSGSVTTQFLFIPEQRTIGDYLTPLGIIVFEIETGIYNLDVNEDSLNVELRYKLFTDKKLFSENDLTIHINEIV